MCMRNIITTTSITTRGRFWRKKISIIIWEQSRQIPQASWIFAWSPLSNLRGSLGCQFRRLASQVNPPSILKKLSWMMELMIWTSSHSSRSRRPRKMTGQITCRDPRPKSSKEVTLLQATHQPRTMMSGRSHLRGPRKGSFWGRVFTRSSWKSSKRGVRTLSLRNIRIRIVL